LEGFQSSITTATAYVTRGWKGNFITSGCKFMEDALILIIEAIAMRDGINAAIDMSFKQIIVEGDKKIVIQSI